jgi:hypothetical protein
MELFEMKLNSEEKTRRKEYKKELKSRGGFIINQFGGTTMVVMPLGEDTARVSFAMRNLKDKYNRKYGEYIALCNMFSLVRLNVVMPLSLVDVIAENLLYSK